MEKDGKRIINKASAPERVEMLKRANIKYILSQNGSVENSRLITVDYPSDINTLRLCDVKRWIWELEGKESPYSLAWSYKRKCKGGYEWIDAKEDDTITPISDNNYIIRATIVQFHLFPDKADKKTLLDKGLSIKPQHNSENTDQRLTRFKIDASTSTGSGRKEKEGYQKRKSNSTNVCCNMLSCARNDANESALLKASKVGRSGSHGKRAAQDMPHQQRTKYKLSGAPSCMQCKKHFDPEKLHLHMKSCKGLKFREEERNGSECRGYRRSETCNDKGSFRTTIPGY